MKLSITYKTVAGDTFELIARKKYGTEAESSRIARANPGVVEPLTACIILIIPDIPDAPQNLQQQTATDNENEIAILIDGKRFRFWSSVAIKRSLDAMDVVQIDAPFNAGSLEFRNAFRPFAYKKIEITIGGIPFFTGTGIVVDPVINENKKTVSMGGYSLPGVLSDCTPPASSFPLEFSGQGLREIADTITTAFGIGLEFEGDQGATFERVASKPNKKALSFIIELAKQRKLIVSSTPRGKLLITNAVVTGNPVAKLQQGLAPVLSVAPAFKPQEYYSHITGLESVTVGVSGSQFTVKNKHLLGVVRPLTFSVPDTKNSGLKAAVEAKVGRMFGNVASYSLAVSTWRDPQGDLWEPNTTIKLIAPNAMIYTEYEFIIRSIDFERDSETETAMLDLVIPGSFSGQIPEKLPWDE